MNCIQIYANDVNVGKTEQCIKIWANGSHIDDKTKECIRIWANDGREFDDIIICTELPPAGQLYEVNESDSFSEPKEGWFVVFTKGSYTTQDDGSNIIVNVTGNEYFEYASWRYSRGNYISTPHYYHDHYRTIDNTDLCTETIVDKMVALGFDVVYDSDNPKKEICDKYTEYAGGSFYSDCYTEENAGIIYVADNAGFIGSHDGQYFYLWGNPYSSVCDNSPSGFDCKPPNSGDEDYIVLTTTGRVIIENNNIYFESGYSVVETSGDQSSVDFYWTKHETFDDIICSEPTGCDTFIDYNIQQGGYSDGVASINDGGSVENNANEVNIIDKDGNLVVKIYPASGNWDMPEEVLVDVATGYTVTDVQNNGLEVSSITVDFCLKTVDIYRVQ